jgi:hypothetical protein
VIGNETGIFWCRFLFSRSEFGFLTLREGDPSFLQTSAGSGLSEFGMTGHLWDIGGRSGDSQYFFMKNFTCESPLLPPDNQQHTCHPEAQRIFFEAGGRVKMQ